MMRMGGRGLFGKSHAISRGQDVDAFHSERIGSRSMVPDDGGRARIIPKSGGGSWSGEGLFVQPVARGLHAAVDRVVQFYFRID